MKPPNKIDAIWDSRRASARLQILRIVTETVLGTPFRLSRRDKECGSLGSGTLHPSLLYADKQIKQPSAIPPPQPLLVLARLFVVWNGGVQEPAYVQRIPRSLIYVLKAVCAEAGATKISGDYDENIVNFLG